LYYVVCFISSRDGYRCRSLAGDDVGFSLKMDFGISFDPAAFITTAKVCHGFMILERVSLVLKNSGFFYFPLLY